MKVNNFLNFLGDSGYESKAIRYIYVYLIAFALLMLQIIFGNITHVDTESYVVAADKLLCGELDCFRTPIYPAIIALGKVLFRTYWSCLVIGFQIIAFFLSAIVLQRLIVKLCNSERIAFWSVAIYLTSITLTSFPILLLTDSLSTSVVVFLLWFILRKYPLTPSFCDICSVSFILLILIFLRPIFIYLLPVLTIYYCCILYNHRATFKIGFLGGITGIVIAFACIGVYRSAMYSIFKIQSISIVTSINNYFPIREVVEPNPDLVSDLQMKILLQEYKKRGYKPDCIYTEINDLRKVSSDKEFEGYVQQQFNQNRLIVLTKIASRAVLTVLPSAYFPLLNSDWLVIRLISPLMPSFTMYFYFIILYVIGCIVVWRHNRQVPLTSLLLLMVTLGITCASIVGAQSVWSRLSLPGFPALLILIAIASKTISVSLKRYYTR